jgi:hypothetical protein
VDWLFELLFSWWWWGRDGRTKTADAADNYVMPILIFVAVACLVALLVYLAVR